MSLGSSRDKAGYAFGWMLIATLGVAVGIWGAGRSTGEWQKFFLAVTAFMALSWLALFLAWRAYRKRS